MSRTKKIAILAIVVMVLTMLPVQMFAATDSTRLSGADREATALAIAADGWTSATTVIVAPADQANLVDALAVAPLAGQENAPILLTFKDKLNADVKAKISALGAKKVYVVGAISDAVKNEIATISGVTVEALKGPSRLETAKAVNAKLTSPAGTIVVGYDAIPDALSAASFAAKNKYAIVLANVDGTVAAADLVGTTKYIVGGTAKVQDIAGVTRIAGDDRFQTNKAVADKLSFSYTKVYVANGLSLVDALAVAPLAAKSGAFVALTNGTTVEASSIISAKASSSTVYVAVGGTSAVSDTARDAAKGSGAAAFAVESVTTNGLNGILVTFTGTVDEDSAEAISNYVLAGDILTSNGSATDAKAEMLSDKKTVEIVLNNAKNQLDSKTFEVKAGRILSEDKKSQAASFVKTVQFTDNAAPSIKKVEATGAKKLSVVFTEPIKNAAATATYNTWKIDGTTISSFGFNAVTLVGDSGSNDFCSEVDFTFTNALPAGSHTLKTSKGTALGLLGDASGYVLPEMETTFTVETVTGAPSVSSVTYDDAGTIYVTFDRSMLDDNATSAGARNFTNYAVNSNIIGTNSTAASFKSRTSDKVVKVTPAAGIVKAGANYIVLDNTIEDAWGNKLAASDDVRVAFTAATDTVKPTVSAVNVLDSKTLRVRFSEKVSNTYVRNTANWSIKKSDGSVVVLGAIARPDGALTDNDTWDMTWAAATLTSTGYTLTLENIQDIASTPNTMDKYTCTFDGFDDVKPTAVKATLSAPSATGGTVAVFYSEKMDATSVTTAANYNYVGSDGTYYALPEGTTLSIDSTGKVVSIKFPSSYTVYGTGAPAGDHVSSKYAVRQIMTSNVKDAAGNVLNTVSQTLAIGGAARSIAIQQSTVVISQPSTDQIKVVFNLDYELTTFTAADFTVAGAAPSSGSVAGKTVTLNFTTWNGNVATVRGAGANAVLKTVVAPVSTAAGGEMLVDTSALTGAFVYDDQAPPVLLGVTASATQVFLQFSEPIDDTITGMYTDDFTVTTDGAIRTVSAANVSGNFVVLTIDGGIGATSNVVVKAQDSKIDIRDKKEATSRDASAPQSKGDYNKYVPNSGDISGRACDPDGAPVYTYAP
ncbi:MAG: cell wall-binding repeat-containing protein [Peptococcaceae bacterium]|nr:cell wall-binding repeat-containing protein [Peptococcaceae bacterium]